MGTSILDHLTPTQLLLDVKAGTKKDLLKQMVAALPSNVVDPKAALKTLLAREDLGSTGVGEGVAIPHGKLVALGTQAHIVFARTRDGVDFGAIDAKPIDLAFLILAGEQSGGTHLTLLAKISRMIRKPEVRAALREADTADQLLEVIREADEAV